MKSNTRRAILKILLLGEDFTRQELQEAALFLSNNKTDDIISFLASGGGKTQKQSAPQSASLDKESKAVSELKDKDAEKYELLREFESLLNRGELLNRLDSIKKLGGLYNKQFEGGKTRKEAIPRLMAVLAKIPIGDLRVVIKEVVDESGAKGGDYAALANYLIFGNKEITLNK
jgi:hypothetical protein